jgi:hypothetical protein
MTRQHRIAKWFFALQACVSGCTTIGTLPSTHNDSRSNAVRILELGQSLDAECRLLRPRAEASDGAAYEGTKERAVNAMRNVAVGEGANVARIVDSALVLPVDAPGGRRGQFIIIADLYRCPDPGS